MNTFDTHKIFQITPAPNALEFIIYTTQASERLNYACQFIFNHVLNCNYSVTQNKEVFETAKIFKINYSETTIDKAFQIIPHHLLFETALNNNYTPNFYTHHNSTVLFKNSHHCNLGYDVFSSVFYFISRYQEWQPFQKEEHGRFELSESIQFKKNIHLKPLVNIWVEELKQALISFYPNVIFPSKKFQQLNTIDVDNLYAYKNKGFVRTIGAIGKDILKFDFKNLNRRCAVLLGKTNDPFDVYQFLIKLSKDYKTALVFFFLQRSNTKFDRTINPNSTVFQEIFSVLKNNGIAFGIHPSYFSITNEDILKNELALLRKNAKASITLSRQHYLRFDIKQTPLQLLKNGISTDFTMGFSSGVGYRAATFTPFYYYNFTKETPTNLLMVPFVAMDGAYFIYSKTKISDVTEELLQLQNEAIQLNGLFVTVFHERTFDEVLAPGFKDIYMKLLQNVRGIN